MARPISRTITRFCIGWGIVITLFLVPAFGFFAVCNRASQTTIPTAGSTLPTVPSPDATPMPPPTPGTMAAPIPMLTPQPDAPPSGRVLAWIAVAPEPTTAGNLVEVTVLVDPKMSIISGGEVTLVFNPKVLEAVSAEAGSFLGSKPLLEFTRFENANGRVALALARVGPTVGPSFEGIFAVIKLRIKPAAAAGRHEVMLEVGLADQQFESVTVDTLGGFVTVK